MFLGIERRSWEVWAAILLAAGLYDFSLARTRKTTLTKCLRALQREPAGRVMLVALWGGLTVHLFRPEKVVEALEGAGYGPVYEASVERIDGRWSRFDLPIAALWRR